jgi:hypothetical protein
LADDVAPFFIQHIRLYLFNQSENELILEEYSSDLNDIPNQDEEDN